MALSKLLTTKIVLVLICALFLFTRLYKISEIPSSLYWDEASIGYNAYSISKDLKDEWGKFLPIHFRAFGEFKLPVYIYSTVPFVKIFGLNELSIRLPSVLFSLGVVCLIFFLARKLTGSEKIGLWSSFFMTISPWFFIFSRTGYEVTAGLMFYLLAILLFLQDKKGGRFILYSIISFILSAYSYNSFRIISPLTILALILFEGHIKLLRQQKIYFLISFILLILAVIPIYRLVVYDAGISRLQAVGSSSQLIILNYFSHFNPFFLSISGDTNLRHQQVGFGQLYFPELILLVAGLVNFISNKSKSGLLVVTLVLLGPIPAAITKESPHALRSLSMVPFIHIISATGAVYLGQFLRRNSVNITIAAVFLAFFIYYFINFLTIYPAESLGDWQYEYKKIFTDSLNKFEQNGRILISDRGGQPYIFALFYLQYDPNKFRKEVVRNPIDKWGFSTVKSFGRFEFGSL